MLSGLLVCFFFFKQKTAYELRISDWSSDVCSSDLADPPAPACAPHSPAGRRRPSTSQPNRCGCAIWFATPKARRRPCRGSPRHRSEEHTSELQSLMRNSYAVFCLKKKKQIYQKSSTNKHHYTTKNLEHHFMHKDHYNNVK